MREFLEFVGVKPSPQQVKEPRRDPFFYWKDEDFRRQ
jgi:sulfite reductase alpha subunit